LGNIALATEKKSTRKAGATRTNDPERTKADIIKVATQEFSENGYSGGRVDEIAERTKTSKRMIYYYFESKDGLYRTVLLEYYAKLRGAEQELHLDDKPVLEAIKQLVEFTFDWHQTHAEGVRLVMVENIHRARHLAALPSIEPVNSRVIHLVTSLLKRGEKEGVIRKGVDPMQLYLSIAALCFFNVSNRYTINTIFGHDMGEGEVMAQRRKAVLDMVLRTVAADPSKI
jgi:AcrR family transcriptional regulator